MKPTYEELRELAEKLLERMKLINGERHKCVHGLDGYCPNHDLIEEAKKALGER